MMPLVLSLLLFLGCIPHQDKLPEYGDISDLKGLTKVYVLTDSTATRDLLLKELKNYPDLTVVPSADEAEFILKCVQQGHVSVGGNSIISELPTFEMTAYVVHGEKQRIAWSKTKTSVRPAPKLLTGDFIGALKKSRKKT